MFDVPRPRTTTPSDYPQRETRRLNHGIREDTHEHSWVLVIYVPQGLASALEQYFSFCFFHIPWLSRFEYVYCSCCDCAIKESWPGGRICIYQVDLTLCLYFPKCMRLKRWVANWIHSCIAGSKSHKEACIAMFNFVDLCSLYSLHANCAARWISKSTPHRAIFESFIPFFLRTLIFYDFLAKVVHAISAEELRMTMNIGTFCPQSAEGPGYSTI